MELSADETANRERYGYSVGESVVALYEDFASAREHGGVCDVALRDVGICAVERVAQLCGALIDADAHPHSAGTLLANRPLGRAAAFLSLRPDLFELCNRGASPLWRAQGWVAGGETNRTLSSLGRVRA